MEFPAIFKSHFLLFALFSCSLLLARAELHLDKSDETAFYTIYKHLGFVTGQHNPCNLAGVYCQRRIGNNDTALLRITRIVFQSQQLSGFLSPEIGQLSELRQLSLANNYLVHQLPSQIVACKKLEILNLQNNAFSGQITSELSSLSRLRILDLASNQFSGNLSFLMYSRSLESLSLNNNNFSGTIPASLGALPNFPTFNFSGNDLLLAHLSLATEVKLPAHELPKRYRYAEDSISIAPSVAPSPAPSKSSIDAESPMATTPTPEKHRRYTIKKILGWILGFLVGGLAGCITGVICSLLFKLLLVIVKGRPRKTKLVVFSQSIAKSDLAFLEKEDVLASLQSIGSGGCGEVYKAELLNCSIKAIAIKKVSGQPIDTESLTGSDTKDLGKKMRQIRSEIKTVGKIRHRNLLSLLAHLSRPDCHYLVYEFMKNGSLDDALKEVSRGNRELDWLARHKIALGISAGLEYLHMNQSPRIIHRDLKPANILIDDDMEARIADFGLAAAVPDAISHVTASKVAGTLGYIAPEYHQTYKFTDKCDIYSFGVMLGVLVMGKPPTSEFFQHTDEMTLVKWMRRVTSSENPSEAIDPTLMGNGYEEQMLLVLKIACFCTLDDPKSRPNSKEVRCMLSQIMH